jgi:hypothetical protein
MSLFELMKIDHNYMATNHAVIPLSSFRTHGINYGMLSYHRGGVLLSSSKEQNFKTRVIGFPKFPMQ